MTALSLWISAHPLLAYLAAGAVLSLLPWEGVGRAVGTVTMSFLCSHIAHVVSVRSNKHVCRVTTARCIAVMAYEQSVRNRAVCQFPGEPMTIQRGAHSTVMLRDLPVTVFCRARPHPTRRIEHGVNRTTLVDHRPIALNKRRVLCFQAPARLRFALGEMRARNSRLVAAIAAAAPTFTQYVFEHSQLAELQSGKLRFRRDSTTSARHTHTMPQGLLKDFFYDATITTTPPHPKHTHGVFWPVCRTSEYTPVSDTLSNEVFHAGLAGHSTPRNTYPQGAL